MEKLTKFTAYLTVILSSNENAVELDHKIFLELVLVSTERIKKNDEKLTGWAYRVSTRKTGDKDVIKYKCDFRAATDYGVLEVGAVLVETKFQCEIFLEEMNVRNDRDRVVVPISCYSWVQPNDKRTFFTAAKSYTKEKTPKVLLKLREDELKIKRGNGTGERMYADRIYDYDVYNDLGEPSEHDNHERVVLGGTEEFPFPRRCRTGRPLSKKDSRFETVSKDIYVPRDERFSQEKLKQFSSNTSRAALMPVNRGLENFAIATDTTDGSFPSFRSINDLYNDGFQLLGSNEVHKLPLPALIERDSFSWLRDEEFARETLAGTNPYAIELVKEDELPLKSKLDPLVYGTQESAITEEIIEKQINMRVKTALELKRLFKLDYHDWLLPYVNKVRAQEGTTLYGSRTIFFLTNEGTLKPIAIELTRPPSDTNLEWRHVFVPSCDATELWLWRLAKAHVCAHDSAHHQLISHLLRTHCVVEPFIIAANRQLSEMHPIYRLLHPHFRYTMAINALARGSLINAGGYLESAFSPLQYSMELSSVAYGQFWRFDKEALPADLIRRGMAEECPNDESKQKLAIADHPFANDGLLVWSAIKEWVCDYVSHYYAGSFDTELLSWWSEVRTKGHPDKKDESWWPQLNTNESLIHILTTIIWITSGHHAAVNFGQYGYAGYFPNRPTIARINMPNEDDKKLDENFIEKPENTLLKCLPQVSQAVMVMSTIEVLSVHLDEEYLGGDVAGQVWLVQTAISKAHEEFNKKLQDIEVTIDKRNKNQSLQNRFGAGIVPYELMKRDSPAGLTGKGVPTSISI